MTSAPATSIDLPDRYLVSHHIASGGMASVWAATDQVLGRSVAVKVLAAHLTQDETARLRFQREARAAAGLSGHPHVVTIFDVGEHDGRSFIVMELMSSSVADVLRGGVPIPVPEALSWLSAAASALDAAHEAGIVHRDVKPANMLLDQRRRLTLADFGIARLAYESQVTETGVVLGTATYISPEQALGESATGSSDVYALAAVAFELLTGGRPFPAEHFAAQARAHIEDPIPAASSRRPELPAAADPVLARGLAKRPAERWPTATAFVVALQHALDEPAPAVEQPEPTRVMSASELRPDATRAPAAVTGGLLHRDAPEPPPGARRRWPLVLAAAAVLALALTGAVLAMTSGGDPNRGDSSAEPRADRAAQAKAERQARARRQRTRAEQRAQAESTPAAASAPAGDGAAATTTPTPTPAPEVTAAPPAAETPPAAATTPDAGAAPNGAAPATGPVDLVRARGDNDAGYKLQRQDRIAESLPPLQSAVENCGRSNELNPCGFALYNYAVSLRRSGRPAEAIPLLEDRLARFSFMRGTVRRQLAGARAEAGQ